MGAMATPARHLRIPDDVWLPAQDLAWRRRTSVTAMVTEFLRSEVETAEIFAQPGALDEIRAAEAAIAAGDVVRGAEAVRALRPRPEPGAPAVKIITDERVPSGTAALVGPDHDGKPQAQVMTNLAAKPERKPRAAPRPRCPHPGLPRSAGGWCTGCQVTLEPGGYLPVAAGG